MENEIITIEEEVFEEDVDTVDEAEQDTSGGVGLGAIAIGGLAAYGLYHAVKGGVKLGRRGVEWAKDKAAGWKNRKQKTDEAEEDTLTEEIEEA